MRRRHRRSSLLIALTCGAGALLLGLGSCDESRYSVEVPDVTGLTVGEGFSRICLLGLDAKVRVVDTPRKAAAERITRTDPPAGRTVGEGTNVDLIVERPPGLLLAVPDAGLCDALHPERQPDQLLRG